MRGIVKSFSRDRGYGFITGEDGKDIFFHYLDIEKTGYKHLFRDTVVEYQILVSANRRKAINIFPLNN